MAEPQAPDVKLPDPVEMSRAMTRIAEQSQRLVTDFLSRQAADGKSVPSSLDPMGVGHAFLEMTARMMADPAKLMKAQITLWQDYMTLWQHTTQRLMGQDPNPVIAPAKDDRRFKDSAWDENTLFDFIKQSYLLTARWMQSTVQGVDGLDDHTAKKVDFYTRQFVDAMAPSNFVVTNPEVLRTTIETGGENLVKGLEHLLKDLERGKGELRISMTDYDAFQVGKNIAVTPGTVVFQNDLIQLIQYTPTTAEVAKRPLMIVPPWINKFYILDLRAKNSFIKWAVDQGHTLFMLSWVNPDERLAAKSFEDYMIEGVLAALDAIEKQTGEREVNAIGYCLGGTLLGSTLAYMATKGDDRIKSATFFTTMLDFTEAGELSVFIDEEQLTHIEKMMGEKGYLDGSQMATSFNMLRANDLIWSFVVNNYLLGKDPFPFDLLYWNSDSTRMPAAMHSFYLRNMYQRNLLAQPGGVTLGGVPIDLRAVKTPTFFLSTREDHIAPWKSTYAGTQLFSGKNKFVLAASGHIAGVVNPPAAEKYCYWTNAKLPKNSDEWLKGAQQTPGSWWPEWQKWVSGFAGGKVEARDPAKGGLPVIEEAPGAYVKTRIG
ncbi:class I poly(R)-hydroxyalkanoic acid synthase [Azospirillum sp. RWY-5-1]|uniref:Class I poly(R)-hydroxyalkanoic acid synthase n=1 Tax=Azospirillum oleiclasticum TaxID=2735135 RepID=A0ABX2T2L9_9PROT|nr:class I poly(R)-hydroxyalkanoic acid synthase [Azospirillum oleiclasticum]NYZ11200.1 class I poly(R)-hydroxyalkanoic acid synthase [Azospirillum oleiclasticum]NYZ18361.1 class I poly(R)-hydroxyalkanoic acid synthase [Azospirillum oleiclasticum]